MTEGEKGATDPRVASVVRELRRLSPEGQAEVARELRKMRGIEVRGAIEAKLVGQMKVQNEWMEYRTRSGVVDARVQIANCVDFVVEMQGESVSVHVEASTGTIRFVFPCADCDAHRTREVAQMGESSALPPYRVLLDDGRCEKCGRARVRVETVEERDARIARLRSREGERERWLDSTKGDAEFFPGEHP